MMGGKKDRLKFEKVGGKGKVECLVRNRKNVPLIGIDWDPKWKRHVIWTDTGTGIESPTDIYGTKFDGNCLIELGKKMLEMDAKRKGT